MNCAYCGRDIEQGRAYREHLNNGLRWHMQCFEVVATTILRLLTKVRY